MLSTIEEVKELLNEHRIDVTKLDIGDRMGSTGYIDFVRPKDMEGGAVKTFVDMYGRLGIAFHFTVKKELDLGLNGLCDGPIPVGFTGVISLFQRQTNGNISYGTDTDGLIIERVINRVHDIEVGHKRSIDACDTCPVIARKFRRDVLASILAGTHEYVGLVLDNAELVPSNVLDNAELGTNLRTHLDAITSIVSKAVNSQDWVTLAMYLEESDSIRQVAIHAFAKGFKQLDQIQRRKLV